ncbi:MAG TPA: hypothetical protein VM582_01180, partial [Candidatus Thermoplasmatota archaeon]|nr:hypothetical protein [Candidatus Thermoplasmatota archaeon]
VFVLIAKQDSGLHRLFFLLALADGLSTILFTLAAITAEPTWRYTFAGLYWYHFIAFIALLALFGVAFPKAPASRPLRLGAIGLSVGGAALFLALYVVDRSLFWSPAPSSPLGVAPGPVGNVLGIGFVAVVALLTLRLAYTLARERSESHRRQGAYILGGMALAYLPFPTTVVAQDLAVRGIGVFFDGRWDRVLAHWAYLAAFLSMLAASALLMRRVDPEARDERAFVLACFGTVLALGILGFALPSLTIGIALRTLALLAYPVLLGWAIVRYEVFDIDRKLRRAATVTLTTVGLTLAFVLAENTAEGLLEESVFQGFSSAWLSGSAAALLTAGVFIPVTRASRKAAARIVPELSHDELHERKLEIYRHSLAGALADGILREGESRTLAALRASLGITDTEHTKLLHEVAPA